MLINILCNFILNRDPANAMRISINEDLRAEILLRSHFSRSELKIFISRLFSRMYNKSFDGDPGNLEDISITVSALGKTFVGEIMTRGTCIGMFIGILLF